MIELEYEKQRLKEYNKFLFVLFSTYHRKDGKNTKIGRILIISALCGSVSRTQILVSGIYGDFRNRDIPNADRILSSNSESHPGSGNRYKQKFRRIDSNGSKNSCCPIYTLSNSIGIPFLIELCQSYFNQLDCETIIRPYIRTIKSSPRHFAHTNFSHDMIACAFSHCQKPPFYFPELLVCNQYAKESGIRILCNKNIQFRMDTFLVLYPFSYQSKQKNPVSLLPHICCYEQDTGSQRTSSFQKKANAYKEFFYACYDSSYTENIYGHFSLCFGIASVFRMPYTKQASSPALTDVQHKTHKYREFVHLLKYSSNLLGIKNANEYLHLLEMAEKQSNQEIYAEHKKLLVELMENHKNIEDIETLCQLSLKSHLKQFKKLQKPDTNHIIHDFYKRKNFIFSHFEKASFRGLFLKGARILSVPNQLMDLYFKFMYPSTTNFYNEYSASLNYSGIAVYSNYEILSQYMVQNICFPNAALFHLMNGNNVTIITENFSLDLSSTERIYELFKLKLPEKHILLLFYLEYDKTKLHEFLSSLPKEIFSLYPPCHHLPKLLLCCMEEAEQMPSPPFAYINEEKSFVYGIKISTHIEKDNFTLEMFYDIVPESAPGIIENHQLSLLTCI